MEKSIFDEAWAYAEEYVNPYQDLCDEPQTRRLPPRENHREIYFRDNVFDAIQVSEHVFLKGAPKVLPMLSHIEDARIMPTDVLREESGFLAKPA